MGGAVSYLEWEPHLPAEGADVLLLHGGGLDSASLSWGELGPALSAAGHRVIAPDHPGYGQSPLPPWTATQDRLVSYVGELVDARGLRDHVLAGLSLGAVMRAYGGNRKRMESSVRDIIRNPDQRTPELVDAIMAEAERGAGFEPFEQWQRDQFLWNRLRTNYLDLLGSIDVPVLIVHGDRDTGVPVANASAAAQRIPEAHLLLVPGAGHWVQRDRPEIVTPAVIEFLAQVA